MTSYSADVRAEHRLTGAQVDALDVLSGEDSPSVVSVRTLASLIRRGLVDPETNHLTAKGWDVLAAYV